MKRIMITLGAAGVAYDFRLPFDCRVVNVMSGLEEQVSGGMMKIELTPGETCWFEVFRKRKTR